MTMILQRNVRWLSKAPIKASARNVILRFHCIQNTQMAKLTRIPINFANPVLKLKKLRAKRTTRIILQVNQN